MLNLLFVELFSATGLNHLEEALHCLFFFFLNKAAATQLSCWGKKLALMFY